MILRHFLINIARLRNAVDVYGFGIVLQEIELVADSRSATRVQPQPRSLDHDGHVVENLCADPLVRAKSLKEEYEVNQRYYSASHRSRALSNHLGVRGF